MNMKNNTIILLIMLLGASIFLSCEKEEEQPDYKVLLVDGGVWTKIDFIEIKTDDDNLRFAIRVTIKLDDVFSFSEDDTYTSEEFSDLNNPGYWEIVGENQLYLNKGTEHEENFILYNGTLKNMKWELKYSNEILGAVDVPVIISYESDYKEPE